MIDFDEDDSIIDLAREAAHDQINAEKWAALVAAEKAKLLARKPPWHKRLARWWLLRPHHT